MPDEEIQPYHGDLTDEEQVELIQDTDNSPNLRKSVEPSADIEQPPQDPNWIPSPEDVEQSLLGPAPSTEAPADTGVPDGPGMDPFDGSE